MAVNDDLLDLEVRHQVELQRLATGIVRKLIKLLDRVDPDILRQIRGRTPTGGAFTTRRLEKLLDAIREINREAYAQLERTIREDLAELAGYEAGFQARLIQRALPVTFDIVTPTRQQVVAAVMARPFQGKLLREWVSEMEAGRYTRLRDAIRIAVVEGETVDQLVRRIAGTKAMQYRDGILNISRRSAEAMARTAINHTSTYARQMLFEENDDLVKAVKWVSTLDSRTTPICRARDGMVFPVNKGPRPPAHINCRSTIVPVVKSWRELGIDQDEMDAGTRASMNGEVPADITYNAWLKQQPAAFQDEVLGPTRGRLFRQGGITMDRFVDRSGRQYTLAELKRRESSAFARAGV